MNSEFRISLNYMGKEKRKKEKNMRQKGEERSLVKPGILPVPKEHTFGKNV